MLCCKVSESSSPSRPASILQTDICFPSDRRVLAEVFEHDGSDVAKRSVSCLA
jgi:hypothetical protein